MNIQRRIGPLEQRNLLRSLPRLHRPLFLLRLRLWLDHPRMHGSSCCIHPVIRIWSTFPELALGSCDAGERQNHAKRVREPNITLSYLARFQTTSEQIRHWVTNAGLAVTTKSTDTTRPRLSAEPLIPDGLVTQLSPCLRTKGSMCRAGSQSYTLMSHRASA